MLKLSNSSITYVPEDTYNNLKIKGQKVYKYYS